MTRKKKVTSLIAWEVKCRCPHCDEVVEGFVGDPRGATDIECDYCRRKFDIHEEADVVIDV